ncbi:MAG: CaiB/BaiF CoA transferase family protein [Acidimicrobiales bacterium]
MDLPGALDGVAVVELASEEGAFAGKLLAELGADVVLVEPPGGHPCRRYGPFLDDLPGDDRSLWWWHAQRSKRSVVLDLDSPDGLGRLRGLVAGADVVVEAEPPGSLGRRVAGYDDLRSGHRGLVWASLTPYGEDDRRSLEPWTDLTLLAAGGPVWNCGYDDHRLPPVRGGWSQAFHIAGIHTVLAVLTALVQRHRTGTGQRIEVNVAAAANVTTEIATMEWLVAGATVQRQTGRHASVNPTAPSQVEAADGRYVLLGFPPRAEKDYRALLGWMDELGLRDSFPDAALLQLGIERGGVAIVELGVDPVAREVFDAGRAAMAHIAAHLPAYEAFSGFQRRGIVCGVVNSPEEAFEDVHTANRGFPVAVEHPELGRTIEYPGAPVRFGRSPWRVRRRAPLVDEHRHEILGGEPPARGATEGRTP